MGRLALMQWVRDLAVLWMLLAGSAVFAAGQPAGSASIGGGESIAAGSFEEPLLPSRSPEATELRELKSFLGRYRKTSETGRIRELTAFLQRHPDSPWATALRVNLGLLHAHASRITRAIGAWEMAWGDGRNHESSALENKARGSKSQEREVFHAPQKAQGRAGSRRVQGFICIRREPARRPEQAVESSARESK